MKAIRYEEYGGIEALHIVDVKKPVPEGNEVLVKVYAASLNDWDTGMSSGKPHFMRLFTGLFKPAQNYQYPGCDVAGCVESIGSEVEGIEIGDRVYGDLCKSGFSSFAEYACVPEEALAKMPRGISYEEAACLPQAGQLAVQGLFDTGRLEKGMRLLINGAGGGVGTLAVQMAKHLSCQVTVVDKAEKLDMLLALGADRAIDYMEQDFCNDSEQYDLILDTKTTRSPFAHNRALRRGGMYATVGGSMFWVLIALALGPVLLRLHAKQHRLIAQAPNKDLALIRDMVEKKEIKAVVDRIFELENYRAAYERFLSANQLGNVVIRVNQENI